MKNPFGEQEMNKPKPSTLFIYGLTITILAFIARDVSQLLVVNSINAPLGLILGLKRRLRIFIILFFIGLIGLFINALVFANTGKPVLLLPPLTIREGAVIGFIKVTLRLLAILGATLIFITQVNVREFIKSLESELRLPKDVAFATAIGLRMLSIVERDAREIQHIRIQRGYRKYPITPSDIASYLRPLLSLGIERATWIGIAAELRGFALRKPRYTRFRLSRVDILVFIALVVQVILLFTIQTLITQLSTQL